MKTSFRQEYNFLERALEKNTYQTPFPKTVKCKYCSKKAIPMLLIDDDEGLISSQGEFVGPGVWAHDRMAIALYFCQNCGEITALWNQA